MRAVSAAVIGGVLAACKDSTGPGIGPSLDCAAAPTRILAVGGHIVINPITDGACVRLPAAGASGAKHLYVALSTAGAVTTVGVSAPYLLTGAAPLTAVRQRGPSQSASKTRPLGRSEAFHLMLRERERTLSEQPHPSAALFNQASISRAVPAVGDQRTFNVLKSSDARGTSINDYVQATATAKVVGKQVAIFVDDAAPAGGYTDANLADVSALFDNRLYRIDTTAFGRESDTDGNGVVIVVLTQRVNALSPDCNTSGSVILGYFFGADLLPRSSSNPGSNEGEIFYGLVPDPANPTCDITEPFARSHLPATFIHEFQHMISFNQHVLIRNGNSEDTWLNEGLSHFAEELGGRQVPDAECPNSTSCENEFIGQGDLANAFAYLRSPEDFFLIEPDNSTGKLEERGANWLFVRWLADHFAADTVLGTEFTRAVVATRQTGAANVTARTGTAFPTLVGEWQLTNYTDDLPGFVEPTARLRYRTWNFRGVAASNALTFPLAPDSTDGLGYSHSGELRAGSGRHVVVVQAPNAGVVDLKLTTPSGSALPNSIEPRIALVRIR